MKVAPSVPAKRRGIAVSKVRLNLSDIIPFIQGITHAGQGTDTELLHLLTCCLLCVRQIKLAVLPADGGPAGPAAPTPADKASPSVPDAAASKPAAVKRPAAAVAKPLVAIVVPGGHREWVHAPDTHMDTGTRILYYDSKKS